MSYLLRDIWALETSPDYLTLVVKPGLYHIPVHRVILSDFPGLRGKIQGQSWLSILLQPGTTTPN